MNRRATTLSNGLDGYDAWRMVYALTAEFYHEEAVTFLSWDGVCFDCPPKKKWANNILSYIESDNIYVLRYQFRLSSVLSPSYANHWHFLPRVLKHTGITMTRQTELDCPSYPISWIKKPMPRAPSSSRSRQPTFAVWAWSALAQETCVAHSSE